MYDLQLAQAIKDLEESRSRALEALRQVQKAQGVLDRIESHMTQRFGALAQMEGLEPRIRIEELKALLRVIQGELQPGKVK
jgi:hypothetical protein